MTSNSLAKQILTYRRLHGLTQKKLAHLLGIDPTTIGHWERDEHWPQKKLLNKLGPTLALRAKNVGASNQAIQLLNYKIDLGSGRISKTNKQNDVIFDEPEKAILFLLGVIHPQDVMGISWNEEKPWIPYIFPNLYYHTSAWDEI